MLENITNWFNINSSAIQAISTLVLVVINAVYIVFTYKIFSEAKKQRELNLLPIVVPDSFHISNEEEFNEELNKCVDCVIKNIGNGPAQHIFISFFDADSGKLISDSTHSIDLINTKDETKTHIHLPTKDLNEIKYKKEDNEMIAFIEVSVKFSDFSNNIYEVVKIFALDQKTQDMQPIVGSFKFKNNSSFKNTYLSKVWETLKP